MIRFTWDSEIANAALRRLLGVRMDSRDKSLGYKFSVEPGKLAILAQGADRDYALVQFPVETAGSSATFVFPGPSLQELLKLRRLVTFEATEEGTVRYVDEGGDGFQWGRAEARVLAAVQGDRPLRQMGTTVGGLLGVALGSAARFMRSLGVPSSRATVSLAMAEELSYGFRVVAASDRQTFCFNAGSNEWGPPFELRAANLKALAVFLRGLEDHVTVLEREVRMSVRDSLGNAYAFPRSLSSARPLAPLFAHAPVQGRASGEAAARTVAHLVREGHALVALRIHSSEGVARIGVRGAEGRFVGEHRFVDTREVPGVVGVDIEVRPLRALLQGVGPGDVSFRLGASAQTISHATLQVVESRTFHMTGRAARAKDDPRSVYSCTIERSATVPGGSRGALRDARR
jgi:hypothetical protein